MIQNKLEFMNRKRKFLFCVDSEGAEGLYEIARQAMDEGVPFDFHILKEGQDAFADLWFGQQKMGTYLYISGSWAFVKKMKNRALKAGFSAHEMQTAVIGPVQKHLVCSSCHGMNVADHPALVTCGHCGQELEVSNHYSRRLDAYLGYVTIK